MINSVIIWTEEPLNNLYTAFNYLGILGKRIICFSFKDFSEERKLVGWNTIHAQNKIDFKYGDIYDAIILLSESMEAVHIFCSYTYGPGKVLDMYKKRGGKNGILVCEKPCYIGSARVKLLKRIIGKPYYYSIYRKYKNALCCILPTGYQSILAYEKYGWSKKKMFEFLYSPESVEKYETYKKTGDVVKFVYVGRFSYYTRGLDVLIKAFDELPESGWTLSLVGGYGENKDEVIEWAEKKKNVFFEGTWNANEVCKKLRDYDVFVCPSNINGWYGQLNEAISAGLGVISTTGAVSDEMVIEANCGIVTQTGDVMGLKTALSSVLSDHEKIDFWKKNALDYSVRIQPETIGTYLNDIIEYSSNEISDMRPSCPWFTRIDEYSELL